MLALYVGSIGETAGKSAICAALGRELKASGRKVGFLKPLAAVMEGPDEDAELMKQVLDLEEPAELLCPVSLSAQDLKAAADEKEPAWLKKITEAFSRVSQGKDVVLLEGLSGAEAGGEAGGIARRIVEAVKARAILVVYYQPELDADQVAAAARPLADNLLGVVINGVPERRMDAAKAQIVPSLERSGIKVLGLLPEIRSLFTVTVGELAEHLGGSILNNTERSDELVESLMVGALSFDSALSYLNTRTNKAVVARGDHADIQMAALNSSTKCLVLTGGIEPVPAVLSRAQSVETPIVLVEKDTTSVVEALEGVFEKARFHHSGKLGRLEQMLEESLDLETVHQAI